MKRAYIFVLLTIIMASVLNAFEIQNDSAYIINLRVEKNCNAGEGIVDIRLLAKETTSIVWPKDVQVAYGDDLCLIFQPDGVNIVESITEKINFDPKSKFVYTIIEGKGTVSIK